MLNGGAAGGGFDQTFLVLQAVAFAGGLVALVAGRALGTWSLWLAGGCAVVSIGSVAYWYVGFPPRDGIDGAGRLLFAVPTVLTNLLLAGGVAWRHWRR